ncbi:hypothetical protein CROQUDRAFT_661826 [Cronartium quercuum f. sp. fusiforme G11]|uniref:Uncharacterized protein n=1 Tax=Cronartium quercuum f. sp. fusiforme G11 TaxID=708437 RepID=A0A9P6NBS0_9BASI|nr:hypothetical protein CROQUDRAFT_661826 [Cronartium quercuum f. sp. fusiforme G11]
MSTSEGVPSRRVVKIIDYGVLGLTCALELAREDVYKLILITADADSALWPFTPPKFIKPTKKFVSPWAASVGSFLKDFEAPG